MEVAWTQIARYLIDNTLDLMLSAVLFHLEFSIRKIDFTLATEAYLTTTINSYNVQKSFSVDKLVVDMVNSAYFSINQESVPMINPQCALRYQPTLLLFPKPPLNLKTVQAPTLFRKFPSIFWFFMTPFKTRIFQ